MANKKNSDRNKEVKKSSSKAVTSNSKKEIGKVLSENPEFRTEIMDIFATQELQLHTGPLPSAETLEKYNNIDPKILSHILNCAEKVQQHDSEMEKTTEKHTYIYMMGRLLVPTFLIAWAIYYDIDLKIVGGISFFIFL